MKIKTKLTLGVGLLFLLIVLLSLVGAFNINALKSDSANILKANYNSLEYCRNILEYVDKPSQESMDKFEKSLKLQEKNTTEIGEKERTEELRANFNIYKNNSSDIILLNSIRIELFQIMDLNMQAIQRKSEVAKSTADKALLWIVVSGSLCFLIAFTLLVNLPSNIADPIKNLTQSIQQIADKNYSERVHFEGHSEFGQLAKSFNTMAEKLEQYNNSNLAKLMIEKQRIETLINNMHDPVIGLDENLKVIFANEEAIKIIGMKAENLIGHSSQELAIQNDLVRTLIQDIAIEDSSNRTKQKPIKIFADDKEGYFEKETIHISITPTAEQTKQLIGHVIILRNITEYQELDLAKTNFIANVSHEFKTPISSIKMSLQLLENDQIGTLNEEQKSLVDSIKDDAGRLLKITGELLNLTQTESGNIQLSILPADPKEILQYAISATQTQADQKQIKFDLDFPKNVAKVHADIEKTAWVLTNLITNAIRYSYDNATIYLTIKEEREHVIVSVRDTGQGIDPKYQNKVFDRYFRVPGTKKDGTGLGLAISKEFIEAQNGHIKVESDFGLGSLFTIMLNKIS